MNKTGTVSPNMVLAPGKRPFHLRRSVTRVPSGTGSSNRSCSHTRWVAIAERSRKRRPGSISINVRSLRSTGSKPNKRSRLRNNAFPGTKGSGTSDSAPFGYVIRSSGQSSRDTPFMELACAHTASTSAEMMEEISKLSRTSCHAASAPAPAPASVSVSVSVSVPAV